jgi:hypothetical protein
MEVLDAKSSSFVILLATYAAVHDGIWMYITIILYYLH